MANTKTYRVASGTGLQYGALLTSTREKLHKAGVPQDAIFEAIPTLNAMRNKGGFKDSKGGGEVIRINIMMEQNTLGKSYNGLEAATMGTFDPFTIAYERWATYEWPTVISGPDIFKNGGGSKIFDLQAQLEEVTYMSAAENINRDLWDIANITTSAGTTGNGGKNINSIPLLIVKVPTTSNVCHGITTATSANTWWANRAVDAADTNTAATYTQSIRSLVNTCNRGRSAGKVDLLVFDQVSYELLEQALDNKVQYMSTDSASPGFKSINFKGCECIWDCYVPDAENGSNGGPDVTLTKGSMYALSSSAMTFHVGKDFEPTPYMKGTYNGQDGMASLTLFYGQLTTHARRNLGVLYEIPLTLS